MDPENTTTHAVTVNLVQKIIDFIEANLLEALTPSSIAKEFYLSIPSVNTLFKIVCDISIMEYIRNRRLTLAGQELLVSDIRIIDLALKYGYETPEAFTKAFTRLHGLPPSLIRRLYPQLREYSPLKVKVEIQGGWENAAPQYMATKQYPPRQEKHSDNSYNGFIKVEGGAAMKTGKHTYHICVKDMKYEEDWRTLLKLAKTLDDHDIAYKVDGKTMIFAHGLEFKLEKICLTFKWGDEQKILDFFGWGGKAESTFPGFKYFDTVFGDMKVRCMFYGDCPGDDADEFLYRNTDTVNVDGQILVVQTLKFYHENAKTKDEYYEMVDCWLKRQNK